MAAIAGPALAVTTVGDAVRVTAPGAAVSYAYLVTNTGNAAVSGVRIADRLSSGATGSGATGSGATGSGATGSGATGSAVTCAATTLAVNASTTCTAAPHTITQADIDHGSVTSIATVSAVAGAATVTSTATAVAVAVDARSGLSVQVTGQANGAATVGDTIRWDIVVTNSGQTTVKGLAFASVSGATVTCPRTTLAPAASVTCRIPDHTVTAAETVTGQVTISTQATGRSVTGPVRSDPAVSAVAVGAPIPFTSVSDLGPTIGAAGGALLAGVGFLLLANPRGPGRRRRRTA